MNENQEITRLKARIKDLEINLDGAEIDLKHFEHRYKKAEVWLKCYTAILQGQGIPAVDVLANCTDKAVKEYWDRFK